MRSRLWAMARRYQRGGPPAGRGPWTSPGGGGRGGKEETPIPPLTGPRAAPPSSPIEGQLPKEMIDHFRAMPVEEAQSLLKRLTLRDPTTVGDHEMYTLLMKMPSEVVEGITGILRERVSGKGKGKEPELESSEWQELKDPSSGHYYFYNSRTGMVTWDVPDVGKKGLKPGGSTSPSFVRTVGSPSGEWTELWDPVATRSYYHNPKTGETTWDLLEVLRSDSNKDGSKKNFEGAFPMVDASSPGLLNKVSTSQSVMHSAAMKSALLGEWREVKDAASGRSYYHNTKTNETRWELPSNLLAEAAQTAKASLTVVTAEAEVEKLRDRLRATEDSHEQDEIQKRINNTIRDGLKKEGTRETFTMKDLFQEDEEVVPGKPPQKLSSASPKTRTMRTGNGLPPNPGDWECSCGFINFKSNTVCHDCSALIPADVKRISNEDGSSGSQERKQSPTMTKPQPKPSLQKAALASGSMVSGFQSSSEVNFTRKMQAATKRTLSPGDWRCTFPDGSGCNFPNYAANTTCYQCGALVPKEVTRQPNKDGTPWVAPKEQLLPGQWKCDTCAFVNHPGRLQCKVCQKPKCANKKEESLVARDQPTEVEVAVPVKVDPNAVLQWTCEKCQRKNVMGADKCYLCHERRPAAVQGTARGPGGWKCSNCETHNQPACGVCVTCSMKKTHKLGSSGDWRCKLCQKVNFSDSSKCYKCDEMVTLNTMEIL